MTSHMQTSQKNVAKIGPKPKNNIKKIAFYAGLFSEQREGGWGDGNGELRGLKDYFYIFLAKMFTILSFFYLVRRKKIVCRLSLTQKNLYFIKLFCANINIKISNKLQKIS